MSDKDDSFGAIKLNKILFRADFTAFKQWGKSITGVEYFALENGPAPKPMKKLLTFMVQKGDIAIREKDYYGLEQHRVLPLRSPNNLQNYFSVEEVNLVFHLIQQYWGRSGKSMSDESHEFLGWALASNQETIPYSVALVGNREPTLDEIKRGLELQSMAEECLASHAARKAPRDNRRPSV